MKPLKLFDAELTLMQYLWEHDGVQAAKMAEDLQELYGWQKSSTYIVLKRLEKKGAVIREKPKYQVRALVSLNQVQQAETQTILDKVFQGSFTNLFANFLNSGEIEEQTLDELQALIDEKKKQKK